MDSDRVLLKVGSGKTQCPPEILDKIYGTSPVSVKTKQLEEALRSFERCNSRNCDKANHKPGAA